MLRDHIMEGDQWPPPMTPMINQHDSNSSYLHSTNSSVPSTLLINNKLLHQAGDYISDNQMTEDLEIDWVHLLSQAGCSSSSSTIAANSNHRDLLKMSPCSTSSGLLGVEKDQPGNNTSTDDMRKVGRKVKKVIPPRVAFHTRSADDILDDGYKWRKYGQKAVKNCNYPRSYYHCTRHTCNVKKQIQRLSKDPGIVVTTYEGIHNHPCEQFMEALTPILNQIQFLTKF